MGHSSGAYSCLAREPGAFFVSHGRTPARGFHDEAKKGFAFCNHGLRIVLGSRRAGPLVARSAPASGMPTGSGMIRSWSEPLTRSS